MFYNSTPNPSLPQVCLLPLILIGFRGHLHVLFTNTSNFRAILNRLNELSSKHYESIVLDLACTVFVYTLTCPVVAAVTGG